MWETALSAGCTKPGHGIDVPPSAGALCNKKNVVLGVSYRGNLSVIRGKGSRLLGSHFPPL